MPVFMCSKSLKRPALVFDEDDVPFLLSSCYENDYVKVAFEVKSETDEIMDAYDCYTPWGYVPTTFEEDEVGEIDDLDEVYLFEQMELVGYENRTQNRSSRI